MKIKKFREYNPISVHELSNLSDDELKNILSVCWHEGKFRCDTIGITDVSIVKDSDGYNISWSDGNGDPRIYTDTMSELIDDIGDGDWNYGLYKKY